MRCDNAGENKSLQKEIINDKPKIKFKFTSPKTPQQSGVVECAFLTLKGRVRSMLNFAGIQDAKRVQLWCEAANTATKINNILVKNNYDPCAHEYVYDQLLSYVHKLRVFGEMVLSASLAKSQVRLRIVASNAFSWDMLKITQVMFTVFIICELVK